MFTSLSSFMLSHVMLGSLMTSYQCLLADLRCQGIIKTMSLYLCSLLSSNGLVLRWSHAGADGGVLHCANVSPWLWVLWMWPLDMLRIGTVFQPWKNVECYIVVKLIDQIPVLRWLAHISSVATTCMGVTCNVFLDTGVRKTCLGLCFNMIKHKLTNWHADALKLIIPWQCE